MENDQRAINHQHWTMDRIDNGHLVLNIKLLTLNIGNWIFGNGQSILDNGHFLHVQWTIDYGQLPVGNQKSTLNSVQ